MTDVKEGSSADIDSDRRRPGEGVSRRPGDAAPLPETERAREEDAGPVRERVEASAHPRGGAHHRGRTGAGRRDLDGAQQVEGRRPRAARSDPAAVRDGLTNAPRALGVLGKMEKVHPKEPHWYLAVLGTAPSTRAKGSAPRSWRRSWRSATPKASRVSRVVEGEQHPLLPATRVRGERRGQREERAHALAHVARSSAARLVADRLCRHR